MLTVLSLVLFAGDVRDLGSDSFPVRQAAQARLERWDYLSWRACAVGCASADLERARRCGRVVRRVLRCDPCQPLCAPLIQTRVCYPEVGEEWLRLPWWVPLLIGRGEDAPPFPDWYDGTRMRARTRSLVLALAALGVPPAALQAGLGRLAACAERHP